MVRKLSKAPDSISLPSSIIGDVEINRILRELKLVDSHLVKESIGGRGLEMGLPQVSGVLYSLATYNKLNLSDSGHRNRLKTFLIDVKAKSPIIHVGIAHEASVNEIFPIVTWLREEIHPTAMVHIDIQPEIIGGFTIRTVNHFYDFSLRRYIEGSRGILAAKIRAM